MIGKFENPTALLSAYESLEREFTRRSQQLRELQGKIKNGGVIMETKSFENELRELLTKHDREVAETMLETFICKLIDLRLLNVNDDMYYEMLEVKDDLLKEEYGAEVE